MDDRIQEITIVRHGDLNNQIDLKGRSAALRVLNALAVIVCGLSVPPGVVFAKAPLGKQWPATQQISMS
ncbi:MAG: hypothetical protein KDA93_08865 [Planctomycetaceae bacterium]|nr:hypothetical protein [Planctomycetaceae bacterium]